MNYNYISPHNAVPGGTISVGIQRSSTTSNQVKIHSLSKRDPSILKQYRNGPSECLSLFTRDRLNKSSSFAEGKEADNVPTRKNDKIPKLPERKEDRSMVDAASTSSRQGNHEILTWTNPKRNLSFKKEITALNEISSEHDRITGLYVSRSSLETVINTEQGSGMEKETGVEPESAVSFLLSLQQPLETELTSIDNSSPLVKASHGENTRACRAPTSRGVSRTYATSSLQVVNTSRRGMLKPQAGVEPAPAASSLLSPQQSLETVPTATDTLTPLVKATDCGNTHACRAPPSRGVTRNYATSNLYGANTVAAPTSLPVSRQQVLDDCLVAANGTHERIESL
jgi:hypothetical protein